MSAFLAHSCASVGNPLKRQSAPANDRNVCSNQAEIAEQEEVKVFDSLCKHIGHHAWVGRTNSLHERTVANVSIVRLRMLLRCVNCSIVSTQMLAVEQVPLSIALRFQKVLR